jgi:DNA segregation ATPase FtsK/SpoIIIE, S-DNA-T family
MRIPRTNFPPASFHDDDEIGGPDDAASPPEGAALRRMRLFSDTATVADQPTWERHFFLAPNVRFTRTPDRDLHPDDAAHAAVEHAMPHPVMADPGPSVAELREMLTTMMILNGGTGAPVSVVPVSDGPVNDNAIILSQLAPAIDSAVAAPSPETPRPAVPTFPELSDFAFWEALDYVPAEEDTVLVPAHPVAISAPQPVAAAVIQPVHVEPVPAFSAPVTDLYRSVSVRSPRTAAPVATRQPVLVAPKPVVMPVVATAPEVPVVVAEPVVAAARTAFPWSRQTRTVVDSTPALQTPLAVAVAPAVAKPEAPVQQPTAVAAAPEPATKSVVAVSQPYKIEAVAKPRVAEGGYEFPPRDLLQDPPETTGFVMTQEQLERNAGLLESVLEDFGIRGEIIHVRPGPVVTLYEFEPAPGVKSSRVIGLADDIARSMSALSARVAVVPGRNVIGIELPNATRETVYFSELIDTQDFSRTGYKLPLCLGKTIGGEPVIAELAKMPHLLVAGTTGSGKSVAINTMILSLLYRLTPEECRLIMVDPKMLELSVYDGIPHLLTPVVTDPKKAVLALKWAVREMEDRYRKMSRLGVRNIDGYNSRAAEARARGETITHVVQTGFEKGTGEPIHENQPLDLAPMPYIVVIVDEMADLMMVAGKEIEGAIQRLAQMARAAGIHLIMATQRPSVDVITGTIKANFPTRISFQVTSKIDSRTILGEQGAEQLLGQGDMLHMAGGGRIARVHGPFVSDHEVEKVVAHLKTQGRPEYLDTVTTDEDAEDEDGEDSAVFDKSDMAAEDGNDLYDKAVKVILRDKKCSTSYIQRRLGIGYNKAASLVERMEKEGLVGAANHVGKREILNGSSGGSGD